MNSFTENENNESKTQNLLPLATTTSQKNFNNIFPGIDAKNIWGPHYYYYYYLDKPVLLRGPKNNFSGYRETLFSTTYNVHNRLN